MQTVAITAREKLTTYNEKKGINVMAKSQHVTPHSKGGWQVKGAGNSKATVRTTTQKEAITIARTIAQNQKTELVIHNQKGQIRAKDSYGNDNLPPRG